LYIPRWGLKKLINPSKHGFEKKKKGGIGGLALVKPNFQGEPIIHVRHPVFSNAF
jgi:hypothetical protein